MRVPAASIITIAALPLALCAPFMSNAVHARNNANTNKHMISSAGGYMTPRRAHAMDPRELEQEREFQKRQYRTADWQASRPGHKDSKRQEDGYEQEAEMVQRGFRPADYSSSKANDVSQERKGKRSNADAADAAQVHSEEEKRFIKEADYADGGAAPPSGMTKMKSGQGQGMPSQG